MSDTDRALAFFGIDPGVVPESGFVVTQVAKLAAEFGAVRLAERRAIAAYLRRQLADDAWATLDDAVEQIERGEHGS